MIDSCRRLGIPRLDILDNLPTSAAAKLIPLEVARALGAVPLAVEEGVLTVAIASPDDREAIETLAQTSGHRVFVVLSPPDQLEAALQRLKALCYEQPSGEEEPYAAH